MTPQELYQIWAPPESIWSGWAKPVLFVQMNIGKRKKHDTNDNMTFENFVNKLDAPLALDWLQGHHKDTAIVLDLPGDFTVEVALQLAQYGFRPVPLYNCATSDRYEPIVKVDPILSSLARNAALLSTLPIDVDAAPVFMLDNARNSLLTNPEPLDFDNRWIIFPQDLPSATFMRSKGIREVLVLQQKKNILGQVIQPKLAPDLSEVVRHWHSDGLNIRISEFSSQYTPPAANASEQVSFGPLSRFRLGTLALAGTILALASRRSSGGGFGRIIPEPRTTGGG